ncbi:hypothetical protein FOB22_002532 [Saccharomyces cerevisiae]|nr:hypothetical protein FOB22_002532 [Saccharomyces cerevisiae]
MVRLSMNIRSPMIRKSSDHNEACGNPGQKLFNSLKNSMLRMYAKQKAVKIGPVEAIATVFPVTGLVRDSDGGYIKTFSPTQITIHCKWYQQWLKYVSSKFIAVSLESDSLTKTSIAAVEDHIMKYAANIEGHERKQLAKVPREAVLNPRSSFALLRSQKFDLGDRVVISKILVRYQFLKGYSCWLYYSQFIISIQVLFDHEIVAGNNFGGRLRTNRGLGLDASFLLNITNRQFIYHSKASKKALEKKKQSNNRTIIPKLLTRLLQSNNLKKN